MPLLQEALDNRWATMRYIDASAVPIRVTRICPSFLYFHAQSAPPRCANWRTAQPKCSADARYWEEYGHFCPSTQIADSPWLTAHFYVGAQSLLVVLVASSAARPAPTL